MIDFNATQAYIRVFGGNASSARRCASRLLQRDDIRQYMAARMRGLTEQANVTASALVGKLVAIAGADISDYIQFDGREISIVPFEDLPPEKRIAIAEIYSTTTGIRFKLYNRVEAIKLLGQYLGIFSGGGGSEDSLAEARKLLGGIKGGF